MKILLIILNMLAIHTLHAQDKAYSQKILIGFNFSPDYNFRSLKNNDGSSSSDLVISSRNDRETARFGYTAGLNVLFTVSQPLSLETGIQFSNKGFQTKTQELFYFPPNAGLPARSKSRYSYQYIGVPLKARFSFGKGRLRFSSAIGVQASFLLTVKSATRYEYSNGSTEKKSQSSTSGFNKVDISPMVSLGIDQRVNNRIHVFAEPVFRYGLIKTKDAPVSERLWNAGLNIGIYYAVK